MKITFLGTSHGYAEKNRFCSGTLIEVGGHSYLIDAGAPIEGQMVNMDKPYSDLRGVFITHMHTDHVAELPAVVEPLMRFRYNDQVTCFMPEKEGLDAFDVWMKALHVDVEKMHQIVTFGVTKAGVIFENEDVKVTAIPTSHLQHLDPPAPAWSYQVEAEGKKVFFSGDMSHNFPEFSKNVAEGGYDLVICEMAHSDLEVVQDILKAAPTRRMIINHYHMPRLVNYEKILPTFPFEVHLAVDGEVIDL